MQWDISLRKTPIIRGTKQPALLHNLRKRSKRKKHTSKIGRKIFVKFKHQL
jgi:hypothetical protein